MKRTTLSFSMLYISENVNKEFVSGLCVLYELFIIIRSQGLLLYVHLI